MKNIIKQEILWGLKKEIKTIKIYKYSVIGSGKYTKLSVDHSRVFREEFIKNNIPFLEGNDAPRGGQIGDYIIFKIDFRRKFFADIKKDIEQNKQKDIEQTKKEMEEMDKIKKYDFSKFPKNDINNFVKNYEESKEIYSFRKNKNIDFKMLRKYLKSISI